MARRADRQVVAQSTEDGCGAACAVMLLDDRGVTIRLDVAEAALPEPATALDLADWLSEHSGFLWE